MAFVHKGLTRQVPGYTRLSSEFKKFVSKHTPPEEGKIDLSKCKDVNLDSLDNLTPEQNICYFNQCRGKVKDAVDGKAAVIQTHGFKGKS